MSGGGCAVIQTFWHTRQDKDEQASEPAGKMVVPGTGWYGTKWLPVVALHFPGLPTHLQVLGQVYLHFLGLFLQAFDHFERKSHGCADGCHYILIFQALPSPQCCSIHVSLLNFLGQLPWKLHSHGCILFPCPLPHTSQQKSLSPTWQGKSLRYELTPLHVKSHIVPNFILFFEVFQLLSKTNLSTSALDSRPCILFFEVFLILP